MKIRAKTLIPLLMAGLGVFWVIYGLSNHGFWHPLKGPMPGFVPTLVAGVLAAMGIVGVIQSLKEKYEPDRRENWTIVLAAAILFTMVFIFGMLISLMAFVLIWLKVYEKASWKHTIMVLIIAFSIVFGAFVLWLGVPFPKGIIFDAIFGY